MVGKAKMEVSRQFILHAIREMSQPEVPEDATLVGVEFNAERDIYTLVVESESYPETLEGERLQKASIHGNPEEFKDNE